MKNVPTEIYYYYTMPLLQLPFNATPPAMSMCDILQAIALFMNGFSMSFNLPSVVQELKDSTIKRSDKMLRISIGFVFIFYVIQSYTAFQIWGYDIRSSIMKNFPDTTLGNESSITKKLFSE